MSDLIVHVATVGAIAILVVGYLKFEGSNPTADDLKTGLDLVRAGAVVLIIVWAMIAAIVMASFLYPRALRGEKQVKLPLLLSRILAHKFTAHWRCLYCPRLLGRSHPLLSPHGFHQYGLLQCKNRRHYSREGHSRCLARIHPRLRPPCCRSFFSQSQARKGGCRALEGSPVRKQSGGRGSTSIQKVIVSEHLEDEDGR